jgi:hypothetical protein
MVQYGLTIRTDTQVSIKISDIKYEKEICARILVLVLHHRETDTDRRTDGQTRPSQRRSLFFSRESERKKIKWGGRGKKLYIRF